MLIDNFANKMQMTLSAAFLSRSSRNLNILLEHVTFRLMHQCSNIGRDN